MGTSDRRRGLVKSAGSPRATRSGCGGAGEGPAAVRRRLRGDGHPQAAFVLPVQHPDPVADPATVIDFSRSSGWVVQALPDVMDWVTSACDESNGDSADHRVRGVLRAPALNASGRRRKHLHGTLSIEGVKCVGSGIYPVSASGCPMPDRWDLERGGAGLEPRDRHLPFPSARARIGAACAVRVGRRGVVMAGTDGRRCHGASVAPHGARTQMCVPWTRRSGAHGVVAAARLVRALLTVLIEFPGDVR